MYNKITIIFILLILILLTIKLKYFIKNNINEELFTDDNINEVYVLEKNIKIIYFAYLKPDAWKNIVFSQMKHLLRTGILSDAELHIALSGSKEDIINAKRNIKLIFKNILSNIYFTYSYENTYEYPGIKLLYDEAIKYPKKLFLYFHSKGMVFHNNNNKRLPGEIILFKSIVENWKYIVNIFNTMPDVNKVCYGASYNGICWFNFFWIRGRCLNTCDVPIINLKNRYYYEDYMSTCGLKSYKDCYNMKNNKLYHDTKSIIEEYDKDILKLSKSTI